MVHLHRLVGVVPPGDGKCDRKKHRGALVRGVEVNTSLNYVVLTLPCLKTSGVKGFIPYSPDSILNLSGSTLNFVGCLLSRASGRLTQSLLGVKIVG